MSKGNFNIESRRLSSGLDNLSRDIDKLEKKLQEANLETATLRRRVDELGLTSVKQQAAAAEYRSDVETYKVNQVEYEKKLVRTREKRLEKRIAELEIIEAEYNKLVSSDKAIITQAERNQIAKARTLAIYDSIIFAISNWSNDGQSAPDVELACQAILFPCIYQKVMEGVEDYYFDEVPTSALLVVQRGREYIRHLREENDRFITDPDQWEHASTLIQEWWVNDGLPILYGARDDDWEKVSPKSLADMIIWRDQPASRALEFPLIWDGMELVKQFSDEIRESSGLSTFNKQQLSTRLEP
jgi:hypothetical protein